MSCKRFKSLLGHLLFDDPATKNTRRRIVLQHSAGFLRASTATAASMLYEASFFLLMKPYTLCETEFLSSNTTTASPRSTVSSSSRPRKRFRSSRAMTHRSSGLMNKKRLQEAEVTTGISTGTSIFRQGCAHEGHRRR